MLFNNSTDLNSMEDTSMSVRIGLLVPLLVKTLVEDTEEVGLVVAATVVVDTVEEVSGEDMDVVVMVEVLEEVAMEVEDTEVEVEGEVEVEVEVEGIVTVDMVEEDQDQIHMHPFLRMSSQIPLQLAVKLLLLFLSRT